MTRRIIYFQCSPFSGFIWHYNFYSTGFTFLTVTLCFLTWGHRHASAFNLHVKACNPAVALSWNKAFDCTQLSIYTKKLDIQRIENYSSTSPSPLVASIFFTRFFPLSLWPVETNAKDLNLGLKPIILVVRNIAGGARSFSIMMDFSVPVVEWHLDTHQHLEFQERNCVFEDLIALTVPHLLLHFNHGMNKVRVLFELMVL